MLGLRLAMSLLFAQSHPTVGQDTAQLFADEGANDGAKELETQLLGVQVKLGLQQGRNLNRGHDVTQTEDHGVCSCWYGNARVREHAQRSNEVPWRQRCGVDPSQLNVLSHPRRLTGVIITPDIPRFRAEEEV